MNLIKYCSFLSLFFISTQASAAAFQLYELGVPIIGTAGVGQAAVAQDASTAYFNPAGMSKLSSSEILLGSQIMVAKNKFAKNNFTTISGNNGGNAGTLIPGMDVYYVYRNSSKWQFGIAMTAPYGGELDYNDGWVGRYVVQNVAFYTINFNPSIAYCFNEKIALGLGVAIEYMNLQETVALPYVAQNDGQANISAHNTAAGFNIGLLWTPTINTNIGLAYRSKITHNLNGTLTFLKIADTPTVSSKMIMPQNVILSLKQKWRNVALLAEAGFANWASMQDTILTVRGHSAITPLDWQNTYRLGIGGQWQYSPKLLLQAGISYDSSPTSTALRQPDLPMDQQLRVGIGMMYELIKNTNLGISYEYINLGKAKLNNTTTNGTLSGYYPQNYINTVQISINVAI